MKKLLTTIVAVIYLVSSTGASLHFHYCMGKLVAWGLGGKESNHCVGCGMEKKERDSKGCCKDEHKFVKNSSDQKNAEYTSTPTKIFTVIEDLVPVTIDHPVFIAPENTSIFYLPPRCSSTPAYILNCVFLI